jgi:hypothetical protein
VDVPAFRKAAAPIHERFLGDSSLRDLFDSIRGLA